MTLTAVSAGTRQVEIDRVAPDAQASTNDVAVLAGSAVDSRPWRSLAYTLKVAANTVTYWVYGANAADYSDEVIVSGPTDIAAAAAGSYAVAQAPYGYYRVKIESKVDGNHGTVTLVGIQKG